ncbi:MAG: DUF4388 domain-containing protein [Opitutaceae bacterium]|nr:DUF4388 domain-containing protein [Opitutaceae bacterium]
MIANERPLTGWLWLRAGGRDFSLPLEGVRKVALCRELRVAPPGPTVSSWWSGVALDGVRPYPLLNLAELIGVPGGPPLAPESVVVLFTLWSQPVGLVCDRFLGIIPQNTRSWPLSPSLFMAADGALPRARLWAGQPVPDLEPERLFTPARRAQFDQAMRDSKDNVDQLWELSELEQELARAPSAEGYLDLAAGYRELGWMEEAERMQARAAEIEPEAVPTARPTAGGLSGPCTPRVLLEVLQVLWLTGKSGELVLDAPGRIAGSVSFHSGCIVGARSGDIADPHAALQQLFSLRGERYQFIPGTPAAGAAPASGDTTAWMAEFERLVAAAP